VDVREGDGMTLESLQVFFNPALRLVIVEAAYQEDGTFEVRLYPVLGIECGVERIRGGNSPSGRPCPDKFACDYKPLIISDTYGEPLILTQDVIEDSINAATELVACPWPPEEDASRLAETLGRVQNRAREKALSNQEWVRAGAKADGAV
jgi:hypothetical protein